MIKKVIYFVLSVLAICYIGVLVCDSVGLLTTETLGGFATFLQYFITYGGVAIVFMYACTNFTGNIFKIVLFILLLLMAILFVLVQFAPIADFFKGLFGLVA